jgi:hypothetical protein
VIPLYKAFVAARIASACKSGGLLHWPNSHAPKGRSARVAQRATAQRPEGQNTYQSTYMKPSLAHALAHACDGLVKEVSREGLMTRGGIKGLLHVAGLRCHPRPPPQLRALPLPARRGQLYLECRGRDLQKGEHNTQVRRTCEIYSPWTSRHSASPTRWIVR